MMSIEWIAFKADGEKLFGKDHSYEGLPMDQIVGFSVLTRKSSMYVNLVNGKLASNGKIIVDPQMEEYKAKHLMTNSKIKLFYLKRAYVDFDWGSGQVSGESLEYVICGWQTNTLKIYLKMNFPSEEIEIEIREIA